MLTCSGLKARGFLMCPALAQCLPLYNKNRRRPKLLIFVDFDDNLKLISFLKIAEMEKPVRSACVSVKLKGNCLKYSFQQTVTVPEYGFAFPLCSK